MKTMMLLVLSVALVGCSKQGGTGDQYGTSSGSGNSAVRDNAPASQGSNTNTSSGPAQSSPANNQ